MSRPAATDANALARVQRQKRKGTHPELVVRQLVRELGHSYRLNPQTLPGSPDLSNASKGWAIFVHGCYWHHHEGCRRATVPKSNREWWEAKFRRNQDRDARKVQELQDTGLQVLVVWECETRDADHLRQVLKDWFTRHNVVDPVDDSGACPSL